MPRQILQAIAINPMQYGIPSWQSKTGNIKNKMLHFSQIQDIVNVSQCFTYLVPSRLMCSICLYVCINPICDRRLVLWFGLHAYIFPVCSLMYDIFIYYAYGEGIW